MPDLEQRAAELSECPWRDGSGESACRFPVAVLGAVDDAGAGEEPRGGVEFGERRENEWSNLPPEIPVLAKAGEIVERLPVAEEHLQPDSDDRRRARAHDRKTAAGEWSAASVARPGVTCSSAFRATDPPRARRSGEPSLQKATLRPTQRRARSGRSSASAGARSRAPPSSESARCCS